MSDLRERVDALAKKLRETIQDADGWPKQSYLDGVHDAADQFRALLAPREEEPGELRPALLDLLREARAALRFGAGAGLTATIINAEAALAPRPRGRREEMSDLRRALVEIFEAVKYGEYGWDDAYDMIEELISDAKSKPVEAKGEAGEQQVAVKKSSEEWSKFLPEWRVIDPDGWDRKNLEASWSELITESEYMRRVYQSTCLPMATTPQPVAVNRAVVDHEAALGDAMVKHYSQPVAVDVLVSRPMSDEERKTIAAIAGVPESEVHKFDLVPADIAAGADVAAELAGDIVADAIPTVAGDVREDVAAEIFYSDSDFCGGRWETEPENQKEVWRKKADRILALLRPEPGLRERAAKYLRENHGQAYDCLTDLECHNQSLLDADRLIASLLASAPRDALRSVAVRLRDCLRALTDGTGDGDARLISEGRQAVIETGFLDRHDAALRGKEEE